jgi:hypothetical protein
LLREYLTETEQSSNFEALSAQQLNDVLKHFYLSARKADGEMYKVNTLESIFSASRRKKYRRISHCTLLYSPKGVFGLVWIEEYIFLRSSSDTMGWCSVVPFPLALSSVMAVNIDELTKNHCAYDKEKLTAMMPEQPDSPFCPVRSFEKYLSKLHPICNKLWQKPLEYFVENLFSPVIAELRIVPICIFFWSDVR